MWHARDEVDAELWVVTALFNPVRFRARYELFEQFRQHIGRLGAHLVVAEAAFGERGFFTAPSSDVLHVRVSDHQELWIKENLLNLATHRLPREARYILYADADIHFTRDDIVSAILHGLQHYDVLQPFATAIDMSPTHGPLFAQQSFGYNYTTGLPKGKDGKYGASDADFSGVQVYHPGYAWAWRRSALNAVGGLIERAITGPADHHMAWALVGQVDRTVHAGVSGAYKDMVHTWQKHADVLKGNVGYVDGTILHRWHGRKLARGYETRWGILIDNQYDPRVDVMPDSQGVLQLAANKPKLRDDLRRYFRSRSEDSIDVDGAEHHIVSPKPGWP